jgi:hypothetical protein
MVSRMLVETRDATQFDEKVEATFLCYRCKIGYFASARYLHVNHVGWMIVLCRTVQSISNTNDQVLLALA